MKKSVIIGAAGVAHVGIGFNQPLAVICGPCVIESREHLLRHADAISAIARKLKLPLIFKSSYDKANRTSGSSFRGLGIDDGLESLATVRREFGIPVVTDVHSESEAQKAGEVVDLLQIPAFLCRQTDLLQAAGQTGRPVLVKKGQFLAPDDMKFAAEKVGSLNGGNVLLCERGTCFGYRDLVVDMRALVIMRGLGYPVVFDATHSVQCMGGAGGSSSGNREYVPVLARAAVATGIDALFLESHEFPDQAPSDGPNMVPLGNLELLLRQLSALHQSVREISSLTSATDSLRP